MEPGPGTYEYNKGLDKYEMLKGNVTSSFKEPVG